MNDFNKILANGNVPVNSRLMKINGHYANGVHYCVVSHFKDNELIEDKIEHMINDEFNSSNIYKKSDEDSLPLDMDKEKSL